VWRTLLALMLLTSPRCAQITQPSEGATGRAASLCRFGRKIFFRNHGGSALIRKFRDFRIAVGAWAQRLELAACVHFVDHGHLRTYALFIQNNAVIDARYAVQVDSCGSQSYTRSTWLPACSAGRPLRDSRRCTSEPTPARSTPIYRKLRAEAFTSLACSAR